MHWSIAPTDEFVGVWIHASTSRISGCTVETYPTSPWLTSKRRPRILPEVRSQGATHPRQGNTPTCLV